MPTPDEITQAVADPPAVARPAWRDKDRYSLFSLARHAFSGHREWRPAIRHPEPRSRYGVDVVGGGGHGLATAY